MKLTIAKKLSLGIVTILILIIIIVLIDFAGINMLNRTSNKIAVEYNELNAIRELRFSFYKFLKPINLYLESGDKDRIKEFEFFLTETRTQIYKCKQSIFVIHNIEVLNELENKVFEIASLSRIIFKLDYPEESTKGRRVLDEVVVIANKAISEIDMLSKETNEEMNKIININQKTYAKNKQITILIGLAVVIIVIIGGIFFIKGITRPIDQLISTTRKISSGNLAGKIKIITNDEIGNLTKSFNDMIDALDKTTVSRNYFDDILKNMINTLIVTDNKGNIETINQATLNLLGYKENELVGQPIEKLFISETNGAMKFDSNGINKLVPKSLINNNIDKAYLTKAGKKIPMLFSSSVLHDNNNKVKGIICVAQDISEVKKMQLMKEQERKLRLIAMSDGQEDERHRIATELHDGLGQVLAAISYSIDGCFTEEQKKNKKQSKNLDKLHELVNTAIKETKSIAYDLMPVLLKDFGLISTIAALVKQINKQNKIKITFNAFRFKRRIDKKRETALYRIIQEALNNVIKHSKAKNADISIVRHSKSIVLIIHDDGIGFKYENIAEHKWHGIGLISMKERVQAFDGIMTVNSTSKMGTEIIIEIPYNS